MIDQHEQFRENLASYALGALDGDEVLALEAHLSTCDSCRADLESFRAVSEGLLLLSPTRNPPPALRRRLEARVAGQPARRTVLGLSWGWAAAGLAMLLLVALNGLSLLQMRGLQARVADLEQEGHSAQTVLGLLAYPGTQSIGFQQDGISGSLLVDKQRNLLGLFAWHLPPPDPGRTYQVWLIDQNGDRTSGGFVAPDPAYPFVSLVIQSPQSLANYTGLGVTEEPLGGSPAPTGPRLFGVDF